MNVDPRSDEELARLIAAGDEAAFAELYRRFFPRLYDFAVRIARDHDLAALVVQASFLGAFETLQRGDLPVPFRQLLFTNAHRDLAEHLRHRRAGQAASDETFAGVDAGRFTDPALAAEPADLARIAWQAVQELSLDDYELLDLSLRQGCDATEMGSLLRARPQTVELRLARAGASFDERFSALLLVNRGRLSCADLDFVVSGDHWSSGLRRATSRHLQGCQTCWATRARYPIAGDLLASLTLVTAPPGWEEIILSRLQEVAPAHTKAAAPPSSSAPIPAHALVAPEPAQREIGPLTAWLGFGPGRSADGTFGRGGRGPLAVVLGGGLLVFVIFLGTLCAAGGFSGSGAVPATATATPTQTRTTTATPTSTSTPTRTATITPTSTPTPQHKKKSRVALSYRSAPRANETTGCSSIPLGATPVCPWVAQLRSVGKSKKATPVSVAVPEMCVKWEVDGWPSAQVNIAVALFFELHQLHGREVHRADVRVAQRLNRPTLGAAVNTGSRRERRR